MTLPDLKLPTTSLFIIWQLREKGFESFLVGGSVRDLLAYGLGLTTQKDSWQDFDFDFATNAKPEEILAVFPESFYENDYGTVSLAPEKLLSLMADTGFQVKDWQGKEKTVSASKDNYQHINVEQIGKLHQSLTLPKEAVEKKAILPNFEITTYRIGERYEADSRSPKSLSWGKTIGDDLSRRDFTINALALTFSQQKLTEIFSQANLKKFYTFAESDYQLIDQYHGLQDLKADLIRAIGDPEKRFQEDPLRLLRAVRFSVMLNFAIEEKTYEAIKNQARLLQTISYERIRDEFLKMLQSDYPKEAIMLLAETGLLAQFLPELLQMQDIAQSGHHLTDVWVHSLDALAACSNKDPIVRLAVLLHDIGKPVTQKMVKGQYTFYNHQVVGAHLAKKIGQRLHLSRQEINRLFILVRQHMFFYQPENSDASIRRFMREVGLENLNDILDLREADRLGSNARKTSWRLEEMKQRMVEQLNQPLEVRDLAINGHDLMGKLALSPGPVLGEVLNYLLELVLEQSSLNEKEILLQKATEFLKQKQSKK